MCRRLPKATATLGLPTMLVQVAKWRTAWERAEQAVIDDFATDLQIAVPTTVWVDGSGVDPKDPHLRRVAWAMAWDGPAGPCLHSGMVSGSQTVGRAECWATVQALYLAPDGSRVVTDCHAVWQGCMAIRREKGLPERLRKGAMGDLWYLIAELMLKHECSSFVWIPSHATAAQVIAASGKRGDKEGNDRADEEAKRRAKLGRASFALRNERNRQRKDEADAMRLIARIQTAVLSKRVRAQSGSAAKARRRKKPAMP